MGHTYTSLMYHVVFGTFERRVWLSPEIMPRLAAVAGGIVREGGGSLLAMNGPSDHVHVVAVLDAKSPVSDQVRDLKAGTSRWLHQTFPAMEKFAWQEGYSAFSVSKSILESVLAYVARQEEHHKAKSFEDELKEFLERHEIEYDPRYLV